MVRKKGDGKDDDDRSLCQEKVGNEWEEGLSGVWLILILFLNSPFTYLSGPFTLFVLFNLLKKVY